MPTSLVGNPWILDATDIGTLPRTIIGPLPRRLLQENGPQQVSQWVAMGQVTWHSIPAVAGDTVIMTDINGHEVIRLGPANGANYEDQIKYPDTEKFEGLIVTSLPSGIVHLDFR